MPTYEFRCEACGFEFERDQKMTDPNPPCPNKIPVTDTRGNPLRSVGSGDKYATWLCGGLTQKLISHTSFILKGDCWASDGYGKH